MFDGAKHLLGQSIGTSMQNLESVAQKWLSYGHFLSFPKFEKLFRESLNFFLQGSLRAVHTNSHAKSGVCSSKNDRVIALDTKEDTYYYCFSNFEKTREKNWTV